METMGTLIGKMAMAKETATLLLGIYAGRNDTAGRLSNMIWDAVHLSIHAALNRDKEYVKSAINQWIEVMELMQQKELEDLRNGN